MTVQEIYIQVEPRTYAKEQRVEASAKATELGLGLHMAISDFTTHYYATPIVDVGKVLVSMPIFYHGPVFEVCVLDSADQDFDIEKAKEDAEKRFKRDPLVL